MRDLAAMTINQLAPLIEKRAVSPVEVIQAVLDVIDRYDRQLNSFIAVFSEEALAAARIAELEIHSGGYRGPLHGIPVAIKDNIAVAGWPTTNASGLMVHLVPTQDATVVTRLKQSGAIILGKNNMHEWAMGGTSAHSHFGAVHNPWNTACIPGGSSGGSAAAVSASLAFAAIGTDGRGSVRIPSSYCGVVGLKPTCGLVSRHGELPRTTSSFDHLGPITKDVADAAILLGVVAGHDDADPTSKQYPSRDYVGHLKDGVKDLRIGIPRHFFSDCAAPYVDQAIQTAAERLVESGATVCDVTVAFLEHMTLVSTCVPGQSTSFLRPFALHRGGEFVDPEIRYRVLTSEFVRAADVAKANQLRERIRLEMDSVLNKVDLLLMPTTGTAAFSLTSRHSTVEGSEVLDVHGPGKATAATIRLTYPFNALGLPAISVPCALSPQGMPFGLQVIGRRGEDDVVLRAAYVHERSREDAGYLVPPLLRKG